MSHRRTSSLVALCSGKFLGGTFDKRKLKSTVRAGGLCLPSDCRLQLGRLPAIAGTGIRWGSPLCVALCADTGCLQPSQPFPPCNPGVKIKLTQGTILSNACLTSPVTFILLPLDHHTAVVLDMAICVQALGHAAQYQWLVSPRLRLTCPEQCGTTKTKSFVFPKVQEPRFFGFPSCLEQHCSLWRSYMQLPVAK